MRPNIFETDTETFFETKIFETETDTLTKIEKSLDTEKSPDEMSHSGGVSLKKSRKMLFRLVGLGQQEVSYGCPVQMDSMMTNGAMEANL